MKFSLKETIQKSEEYGFESLDLLKHQIIIGISFFFIAIMVPVTIFRFLDNETVIGTIDGIAVLLISVVLYRAYKGNLNSSLVVACMILTIFIGIFPFFELINPTLVIPQLTVLMAMFMILLQTELQRIIYGILSAILLFTICIRLGFRVSDYFIFLIEIIGTMAVFYLFAKQLSKTDYKLNKALRTIKEELHEKGQLNEKLEVKNKELETFSHIMSHDLKAPIRTINSFVGLIKETELSTNDKTNQYFNYIENSTKEMETIINDLLLFQSINEENILFENILFSQIIDPIIAQQEYNTQAEKFQIFYENVPDIYGNKVLLDTLFRNLIGNGLKYQPFDKEHIPTITIRGEQIGEKIKITVSDNGIGIKEKYLSEIFKPFKRLHTSSEYKGTGLGLSICKRVMEKHKGEITILNTSNKGTTFLLEFGNLAKSN